ncbi:hypothetical protein V6N13_088566 [Hibiscus sabdariffa]
MVDTRDGQGNESPRGSSNNGDNARIGQDPADPPVAEPRQAAPTAQMVQQECMLSMKEMFNHLLATLKQEHPIAPPAATPDRAPIDKLAQHRAYTFTGTEEANPEVAEYWLETTVRILTKQLPCSDEHKLECVVALLAYQALSWWETTILTAPADSVTWKFFLEEFKKKYVSEQYLDERRKRFLYLKQGDRPVEQYVADFCKYCKYGSEYIQTEVRKCKKFIDGLNDDLSPLFTALDIPNFQNLVNRAIATEAKMKAAEKRSSSSHRNDKRPRTESKPQWQFKKPKSYRENSSAYVSIQKSSCL